ncbi:MAG: bifunctional ornithine acetyltransferase/N-acetylglutamate synthase [Deltaproteobacteria bacterium GWC2_42_11]|nr:MAG: bifunctional ornithine acetyltransferase/N-acetylglutamate synthase [Deltaproteobacteria bacterium GWC2_42_11]HBO83809.1 ornithine acetyltransferase [Deltaproteobacteria bacterium]
MKVQNLSINGFKSAGIHCGIKKDRKKDLAIIYSEVPALVAGVFTKNKIKAAPVLLGMQRLKNGLCQAVIINSGNANACTGKQGLNHAKTMVELAENALGIKKGLAFVASTGVIGQPLPMDKIKKGIANVASKVSTDGWENAAQAIMTTDAFPKIAFEKCTIDGKEISMLGIAKGAGMIKPDMATMLSFIATDVNIERNALQKTLKMAVDNSFNCITVDGDTSTNDTVLVLANGFAKNPRLTSPDPRLAAFQAMIEKVCKKLAFMLVMDGEGATKFLEFKITGAKNNKDAKRVADTAANSLLVKTAFFGEDANWGRIMAAIGRAGVDVKEEKINIYFNDVPVVLNGQKAKGKGLKAEDIEKKASKAVKQKHICIKIELGLGKGSAIVWASDLSYEYVKINASYRT